MSKLKYPPLLPVNRPEPQIEDKIRVTIPGRENFGVRYDFLCGVGQFTFVQAHQYKISARQRQANTYDAKLEQKQFEDSFQKIEQERTRNRREKEFSDFCEDFLAILDGREITDRRVAQVLPGWQIGRWS